MRAVRLFLVAATLAAVSLAGCASKAVTDTSSSVPGVDVKATPTTGVIRGVVVDTAIRPVANAHITLKAGDRTLSTDSISNGGFGFQGLAPGTYVLSGSKLGFTDAHTDAEVVAGDSNPPLVKMLMEPNPSTRPYVESYVFKGFMDCSATAGAPSVGSLGVAVCALPNGATCGLDPLPCANVTQDNTQVHYQPSRVPTWVQSEMVWSSTQALGADLSVMYSWECGQQNGGFPCDHSVDGTSPLLLTANQTAIRQIGIGNGTDLWLRVFNTAAMSTGGVVGATVEQEFTIYTHIFYGFAPPDGYRFSRDGDPVVPT